MRTVLHPRRREGCQTRQDAVNPLGLACPSARRGEHNRRIARLMQKCDQPQSPNVTEAIADRERYR